MGKLFGTDGVRGIANEHLSPELTYKLGLAGAYVLTKETNRTPRILVGMDTRISGTMLEAALTAGMCSVGAEVCSVSVVPTPAIAYLVRKYEADAGVVISASHNPVKDNGIKFFDREGYKLKDELEDEIEDIIFNRLHEIPRPTGKKVGFRTIEENATDDYVQFLMGTTDVTFESISAAIDCANGATYMAATMALKGLGADVTVIHNEPDGININKNCGSTHMESLVEAVKAKKVDIGIAFDGDGDRCLAVDENGVIVDGDEIMAILALHLKESGRLKGNTVVATVMSNLGLFMMGKEQGLTIYKTKVGDRYVLEQMLEYGYNLGGEQSGHIIFLDHNTTGDGILTAIQLMAVMKKTGKKLSELKSVMEVLPQVLVNAKVSNDKKKDYLFNPVIKAEIKRVEQKFKGDGRVLIRSSGTEPLVRVMIEGRDQSVLEEEAKKLAKLIEELLR